MVHFDFPTFLLFMPVSSPVIKRSLVCYEQYPKSNGIFLSHFLQGPMQGFRHELLTNLVFVFLSNHPNSAIVLQAAWNVQTHSNVVRALIMHAMADWYVRGGECEQGRLSRILDVAQDLKALSMLLSGNSFPLVIDLACLASRREYLKLDKWLTDKIYEHKEPFIQACVNFLKRRCPQILGGIVKEENLPKSAQLPPETLATMLSCLQQYAAYVSWFLIFPTYSQGDS